MRLWADMYNAAGARQGGGPVALRSASVTRVLDGVGSITITVPGTDGRAVSRLQNESSCRIWMQPTDSAAVRRVGCVRAAHEPPLRDGGARGNAGVRECRGG